MEIPKHPLGGASTNKYLTNDDGSVKVAALYVNESMYLEAKKDMEEYKWRDGDFLLAAYPKNGTHFMWEIMNMLLHGSEQYIPDSKGGCQFDVFSFSKMDKVYSSPRILNTHYRLDVLPKEFRGRKTVLVLRNPKDVAVSFFHQERSLMGFITSWRESCEEFPFSTYLKIFLYDKDRSFGSYFDYTEYMWSLRDEPYLHIVYYEDLVTKLNEFMETQRSPELIQKIAEATSFKKMKEGKADNFNLNPDYKHLLEGIIDRDLATMHADVYRKGKIGDWKNHFTVAENEMFDEFLDKWTLSKEIPFRYS